MDAFEILGGQDFKRGRGRPRKYEPTLPSGRGKGRPTIYGNIPLNERMKLAQQKFQAKKRAEKQKDTLRVNAQKILTTNQIKTIFQRKEQGKLQLLKPTNGSFNSYSEYQIWNNNPENIKNEYPDFHHTSVTDALDAESPDDIDPLNHQDVDFFLKFYKIADYLKAKKGYKFYLSMTFLQAIRNKNASVGIREQYATSKALLIINEYEIDRVIADFVLSCGKFFNDYGLPIFQIQSLTVSVAKVNSLTGSSYIPLPDWINNKKACINIKNDDNLCFLYSVLCGIDTPLRDPQRVSKYKSRLEELNYNDKDMPMCINKIMFFEKKNKLRINVFGIENKDIITLYNTHLKTNIDYPLINLLYFGDGEQYHYSYIKDLSKLLSKQSNGQNNHHKNLVCPYCLEFQTCSGNSEEAMKKHQEFCISGQRCNMPKEDEIKFKRFSNSIKCPIRIYNDFEAINKVENMKSKNGNTSYDTHHKGVSFKFQCVSELPLNGFRKVGNKYTKTLMYDGYDAPKKFVEEMVIIEEEITKQLQDFQYQHKFLDCFSMTKEQKKEYSKCKNCKLCNEPFSTDNNKVKHHNHNTGELKQKYIYLYFSII